MFAARGHVRAPLHAFSFPRVRTWQSGRRNASAASQLVATNELAQKLKDTEIWNSNKRKSYSKKSVGGDRHRINIVSDKLCDDILGYIGPGLARHVGCDLIDINPGAGLWSTKLHDFLKPRKHILLEPDDVLYKPFLEPLLSRENVTFVPESGVIWEKLAEILSPKFLPHQTLHDYSRPAERNDSLLVTLNLAFHPKKRYKGFENLATLVVYQLVNSIRCGNLFQKYGRVRLLIWAGEDEKMRICPHSVPIRRRLAQEAELSSEWVTEVAGTDVALRPKHAHLRDAAIDLASMAATSERMRKSGITIPPGRETALAMAHRMLGDAHPPTPGEQEPYYAFPYIEELRQLEERKAQSGLPSQSADLADYQRLLKRRKFVEVVNRSSMEFMRSHAAIADMYATDPELAAEADEVWNREMRCANKHLRGGFAGLRDNLHVWYQDPPVLMYDRRPYEKLKVDADEFFPNVPCSLIDMQPKAMNPLLHDMHPGLDSSLKACLSAKGGPVTVEILTQGLAAGFTRPVETMLQQLSPGLAKMILPHCPSLRDRRLGGSPVSRLGGPACRTLNEAQIVELVEAYIRSPHTPSHYELAAIDPAMDAEDELEAALEVDGAHGDDFDETLAATEES